MRSPPPPAPQSAGPQGQQGGYGYGGQQQNQGFMGGIPGMGGGQFGGFINESTATMGVQMAEKYMDQQFSRYVNVSALKNLFNGESSRTISARKEELGEAEKLTWNSFELVRDQQAHHNTRAVETQALGTETDLGVWGE